MLNMLIRICILLSICTQKHKQLHSIELNEQPDTKSFRSAIDLTANNPYEGLILTYLHKSPKYALLMLVVVSVTLEINLVVTSRISNKKINPVLN